MQASSELETNRFKWRELDAMYKMGSLYNLDSRQDERGRYTNPNQQISRVSSSLLRNAVDTVTPRLMSLFNSSDGWFIATPFPGSNTKAKQTQYVEDKLKAQFDETAYRTLYAAMAQMVKFGLAVVKIRWDVEIGKVVEDVPIADESGRQVSMQRNVRDDVVFRGNKLDLVPYWQFAPDPKGRSIDECEYVIEELFINVDRLMEIAEQSELYDVDAVRKLQKQIDEIGYSDPRADDSDYTDIDTHRRDVRILDYWEDKRHFAYGLPRWGGNENSSGVIVNKERGNPYYHQRKPYVDFRMALDEKSFYSQGIIEPLRDLHNIQSTALNQFIDAITMNLRPMRLINADMDVDIKELMNYVPNKPIPVEDVTNGNLANNIFEFKPEITGILNSLLPFMQQTDNQANKISGVTDYITGNPGMGANRTASGVAMLTQNAESRGVAPVLLIAVAAQRMLKLMHENNQQFADPREPLAGDFQFITFNDAYTDRMTRIQGLQALMPFVLNLGGDVNAAVRRMANAYGIWGIDELLPRDGSMEEEQQKMAFQQMMQMMAMQNQRGGGNG